MKINDIIWVDSTKMKNCFLPNISTNFKNYYDVFDGDYVGPAKYVLKQVFDDIGYDVFELPMQGPKYYFIDHEKYMALKIENKE